MLIGPGNVNAGRTLFYVAKATNAIEPVTSEEEIFFQKLFIYPAANHTAGILNPNTGTVYVGKRSAGPAITPLPITNDQVLPILFPLPEGQSMRLSDVLIQGAAGDGVFLEFW